MPARPPYKPPRPPRRPAWVTTGLLNGSLIAPGIVALAAHDDRNQVGAPVAFTGYPNAMLVRLDRQRDVPDTLLGKLDRDDNQPAPAKLAKALPKRGETIYVVDDKGEVHSAKYQAANGPTFTFIPSFRPTFGDSGGAIMNAAGELLGHVKFGTQGMFYGEGLGKTRAKR